MASIYTPDVNLRLLTSAIARKRGKTSRSNTPVIGCPPISPSNNSQKLCNHLPFSKVFQILTYIRQERPNERYRNTVKELLLPNTISQKDEKPYTAGVDDTSIPAINIKISEIPLEKKRHYGNIVSPHASLVYILK